MSNAPLPGAVVIAAPSGGDGGSGIAGKVFLVVGGLALVGGGIYALTRMLPDFGDIGKTATDLIGKVPDILESGGKGIGGILEGAGKGVAGIGSFATGTAKDIAKSKEAKAAVSWTKNAAKDVGKTTKNAAKDIGKAFKSIF